MRRSEALHILFKPGASPLNPGEIAFLKGVLLNVRAPDAYVAKFENDGDFAELSQKHASLWELDLEHLMTFPETTLGRHYAKWLCDNDIKPFRLRKALRLQLSQHNFFSSYLITHDFIHVVSGFDSSLAGEIGVLALSVSQGFAPGGTLQEWSARMLYPIVSPRNTKSIRKARLKGRQLGRQAKDLFRFDYYSALSQDLDTIRRDLNLNLNIDLNAKGISTQNT